LPPIIDIINIINIDLIRRGERRRRGKVLLHPTKIIPLHGIENSWSADIAVLIDIVVVANATAHGS
jgi:hypothetical protein